MPNYKYKLTIKVSDTENQERILARKEDICTTLGMSISALNNFMLGRTKQKYDYLTIERVFMPDEKKKVEPKELTDEEKEEKKQRVKEINKKYYDKRRQSQLEDRKKKIVDAVIAIPEITK